MSNNLQIDALEIVIEKQSSSASSSIKDLSASLRSLKTALSGNTGENLKILGNNIARFNAQISALDLTKINKLANSLNKIKSAGGFNEIAKITKSTGIGDKTISAQKGFASSKSVDNLEDYRVKMEDLSDTLTEVSAKSDKISATQTANLQKGYANLFNTLSNTAKYYPEGTFDTLQEGIGNNLAEIESLNSALMRNGSLTDEEITRYNTLKEQLAQLSASYASLKAQTEKVNLTTTKSTSGFTKLFSAIKRIALYRLIRTALHLLTQALKEGINNLYQFDKASNGKFSQSMDNITSSFEYLKNSLATMIAPIIMSLEPFIRGFAVTLGQISNGISRVMQALRGESTYWKANIDYIKKYKKEAKTLGFDELNQLNDDGSNAFFEAPVGDDLQWLVDFGKAFKDFANFLGLHGDALTVALSGIATLWLSETTGLGNYINLLPQALGLTGDLTGAFGNKNRALQTQSTRMAKETALMPAFSDAMDLAIPVAWVLGSKLFDLGDVIDGLIPKTGTAFDVISQLEHDVETAQAEGSSVPDVIGRKWEDVSYTMEQIARASMSNLDFLTANLNYALDNLDSTDYGIINNLDRQLTYMESAFSSLSYLFYNLSEELSTPLYENVSSDFFSQMNSNFDGLMSQLNKIRQKIVNLGSADGVTDLSNSPALEGLVEQVSSLLSLLELAKQAIKDLSGAGQEGGSSLLDGIISSLPATNDGETVWNNLPATEDGIIWGSQPAPAYNTLQSYLDAVEQLYNYNTEKGLVEYDSTLENIKNLIRTTYRTLGRLPSLTPEEYLSQHDKSNAYSPIDISSPVDNPVSTESPEIEIRKISIWERIGNWFDKVAEDIEDVFDGIGGSNKETSLSLGLGLGTGIIGGIMSLLPILALADGAYDIPAGQLFVANEAGAELVGTVGGKTSVANNQEITGIADAVYTTGEQERVLLAEQNRLLMQILAKSSNIQIDGRTLLGAVRRAEYSSGVQINQGGSF